jgi:hypothetical protein
VLQRLKARISPEDCDKLEEILTLLTDELMPEVPLPKRS